MSDLSIGIKNTKQKYREIFLTAVDEIQKRVEEIKPENANDIFDNYEPNSAGYLWQKSVLKMFDEKIAKDIFIKWRQMLDYRKNFSCTGCATCCNLACSEFPPEQLKEKAQSNDKFAAQFTGIFIPYETREEAEKVYPEYLKLLDETLDEEVYFYHCPKLNECKKCSDYENRPQICRDFPDNPLSILPESCGFHQWREEVQPVALMLHSMIEIVNYYKEKINI